MNSYTTSIEINSTKEAVFQAISKDLKNWWGRQDIPIDKSGIIFKVAWGEPWDQFKVTEYVENKCIVWECIDANQKINGLEGVEKEWVGTKIHWELHELNEQRTLLKFRHEGLVPEFVCFDFCSESWERFLHGSLMNYLARK